MLKRTLTGLTMLVALATATASGDTLEMTGAPQANDVVARGLSMDQVERRYGEPAQRIGAVGDPPISRWVYPQFVVYFEGQFVIHAVATRPST
jgi:hypothetical protein